MSRSSLNGWWSDEPPAEDRVRLHRSADGTAEDTSEQARHAERLDSTSTASSWAPPQPGRTVPGEHGHARGRVTSATEPHGPLATACMLEVRGWRVRRACAGSARGREPGPRSSAALEGPPRGADRVGRGRRRSKQSGRRRQRRFRVIAARAFQSARLGSSRFGGSSSVLSQSTRLGRRAGSQATARGA